jgi:ferredoxin
MQNAIHIDPDDIRGMPEYIGAAIGKECNGCEKCVTICPGLAITLVDYRKDADRPTVTLPYEFSEASLRVGDLVTVMDATGAELGDVEVTRVRAAKVNDRTIAIRVQVPREYAKRVAGIRVEEQRVAEPMDHYVERLTDDTIVCRCERVSAGEIRELIRQGYRDVNEIKTVLRAGMGACGSKTCGALVRRLFRDEGVPDPEVTAGTIRPLYVEAPLGVFAGVEEDGHG